MKDAVSPSKYFLAFQSFYFAGTNSFNLIDASAYSKASIYNSLVQHWNAGVRVRPQLTTLLVSNMEVALFKCAHVDLASTAY